MSDIDWLKTSRDLLIGLVGKCMWRPFADWSRIGVVSVISTWSLHALCVEKCWGVGNDGIDVVLAIAGQLHAKEMSNSSTCYIHKFILCNKIYLHKNITLVHLCSPELCGPSYYLILVNIMFYTECNAVREVQSNSTSGIIPDSMERQTSWINMDFTYHQGNNVISTSLQCW